MASWIRLRIQRAVRTDRPTRIRTSVRDWPEAFWQNQDCEFRRRRPRIHEYGYRSGLSCDTRDRRNLKSATACQALAEGLARSRLVRANSSDGDFGHEVIFALHGITGHSPQHRNLANVRERVRNRPLKQFLGRHLQRFV